MTNQIAINQKEVSSRVMNRIEEMQSEGLALPANYNPSNALQVAFLKLQDMQVRNRPLLEVVSKKSVYESLLNMTLQGLSPAKNQCYFIPYGDQLQMQRSYFGTQAALKRLDGVNDIWANVIYDGDEFEIEIDDKGRERLQKHKTSFLNKDNDIVGAYAIIDTEEDGQVLTAMTRKQIENSWSQAKTTNVHKKFPEEMAKRTVINRAAKNYINTSDDSDLLVNAINETTENEYDEETRRKDVTEAPAEEKSQSLAEKFKQRRKKEIEQAEDQPKEEPEPEEAPEAEENVIDVDYEEIPEEETEEQEEQVKQDPEEIDWDAYTVPQIQKALESKGVVFSKTARKDELVKIATNYLSGGGVNASEQPSLF